MEYSWQEELESKILRTYMNRSLNFEVFAQNVIHSLHHLLPLLRVTTKSSQHSITSFSLATVYILSTPWTKHSLITLKNEREVTPQALSQLLRIQSTETALIARNARNANWSDSSNVWSTHQLASFPPLAGMRRSQLESRKHPSLTYTPKRSVHATKCCTWETGNHVPTADCFKDFPRMVFLVFIEECL